MVYAVPRWKAGAWGVLFNDLNDWDEDMLLFLTLLSQQQQIGSPKTTVSVTPVSFFSSREEHIGRPVSPANVAKIRRDVSISPSPIPISADWFQFWVPYTTVVLENLMILIIPSTCAETLQLTWSCWEKGHRAIDEMIRGVDEMIWTHGKACLYLSASYERQIIE